MMRYLFTMAPCLCLAGALAYGVQAQSITFSASEVKAIRAKLITLRAERDKALVKVRELRAKLRAKRELVARVRKPCKCPKPWREWIAISALAVGLVAVGGAWVAREATKKEGSP